MTETVVAQAAPDANAAPVMEKRCRYGNMLFLRHDQYIGRSLALYGEFSEFEGQLFGQLLSPGDVVVEVGANIGAHTVHLAQLVGPGGVVHAFEPQRVIFQILCANMALNGLFNVHTHQVGLGSAVTSMFVPPVNYAHGGNFGGLSLSASGMGEKVPIHTLDELALPSLKLIKIDVEGMEREALDGARRTINERRPFIYVENDRKEKSAALLTLLDTLGYAMYWHLPPLFNVNNFAGNAENIFPDIVSINLFCVPREASVTVNGFRSVSGPDDWWQNAI